jgi:uncharacterized Zn finger protein (UPF0148 family)
MYRVCCPCCYKRQKKNDDEFQKSVDGTKKKRSSKKSDTDGEKDNDNVPTNKYSAIHHLTNATAVVRRPPIFAKYMLQKSVARLNTEVCCYFDLYLFYKNSFFY